MLGIKKYKKKCILKFFTVKKSNIHSIKGQFTKLFILKRRQSYFDSLHDLCRITSAL